MLNLRGVEQGILDAAITIAVTINYYCYCYSF